MSCGTPYQPEEKEESKEIAKTDEVPPDGILETVTWNLNWYGADFNGPSDQELQTKNIIQVIDSLDADLYAFQEVNEQEDLNNIVDNMRGYRGFIAEFSQGQKMAFAYNTNTIDSLEAGLIVSAPDEYDDDWEYYWANGRVPLFFHFTYTYEDHRKDFFAVVIHGKANVGSNDQEYAEAYKRRKKAAEGLYYYLKENKPNENIVLLGDYNDDVDESIYYSSSGNYEETPYYLFVNDTENFDVISKKLSDAGQSASINYEDIIDHITISDELFNSYVKNSTSVYKAPMSYIDDYGNTTSDHLPVWAKFDITSSKSLANSR